MTHRLLTILAVLASLCFGACSREAATRRQIDASRVITLSMREKVEYLAAGSETRPSVRLPASGALPIHIPAGPRRIFRTAVLDENEADGAEQLVATLDDGDPTTPAPVSTIAT